jgi:putative nucleotidyltransferase with HDIG domain
MLKEKVRERTAELEAAQMETLERLAIAAEYRDDDTGRHTRRVGKLAEMFARAMGLPEDQVVLLKQAAPLHDVGKIGVPDAVLLKPGALTLAERGVMQTHTTIGARILSGGRSPIMRVAEEIARWHHEKWNGSGYPEGRAGERIPVTARIVALADVLDALSSARVYRPAWPIEKVLAEIKQQRGAHFEPGLADLCWRPDVHEEILSLTRIDPHADLQRFLRE